LYENRIGGIIGSVLASSAADRGLKHRSGQTNVIKMSMCCIKEKIKDWLVQNPNNVSILNNRGNTK
jgi:hypothetical protein